MSDIVKLQIKIEGSDSFKEVEVSAKDLAEAIDKVKKHTHDLNEKLLNVNQIAQTIDQVSSMMRGLQSVMHDLTDTYAVQAAAEARLEQMMRNTMDATDDEIQSIKDLAAEQQKLGVIGDEVILSGAQELATYMQKKESLEALIPVMDDMIAQQYGFNASAESAVSVAQMMGKVFAGEVGALKRLGYTFDEAQEQILKFGTEEEKVATLTEVVGQIVDGTNAKLAATPYGKIAQFRNDLGDIKEHLGEMVAPAMNAVDVISSLTIALAGLVKGATYLKAAAAAMKSFSASAAIAATRTAVLGVHSKVTATAQNMLAAAGIRAAAGTTALKIAVTGLYAAMSLGLTLAIQGIITLITRLVGKSREAADGMDAMKEANEAYKSAVSNTKAEIDAEVAALKSLMDQGKDTKEAIQNLNEKYGEAFGYHKTASEWYDTLTNKSLVYCRQLGYEAKAKSLSASIGAKIVERDELKGSLPQGDWQWDASAKKYRDMSATLTFRYADRDTSVKLAQIANLEKEITADTEKMNAAWDEASKAAGELKVEPNGKDKLLTQEEFALVEKHYDDLTKKQRAMIDKGYQALTDEEKRALKKRYTALTNAENKEVDKQYKEATKAAEKALREKENALKQQYLVDNDNDAYESGMERAAIEGLEAQLDVARKYGKDTTKIEQSIADAKIQQRKNEYNRELTQLESCLEDEKLALSMSLADKEITQEEYDRLVLESENRNAEERLELAQQYGQDTVAIQQELANALLQQRKEAYDRELAALDDCLADTKLALSMSLVAQEITQEQHDRDVLVELVQYYEQRLKLAKAYGKAETGEMQSWLDAQLDLQNYDKQQQGKKTKKQSDPLGDFTKGWSGIKGIGNSIRDIKDALTETDNAWDALTQTVDGFISLFQSLQQVTEIIDAITAATQTMQAADNAATQQQLANDASKVAGNTAVAGSGAASAMASIPYVGPVLAIAAVASILATLATLPKFANGGLVYGPTVGLMGEYSGASNNPEVIAPLNKLRSLLGDGYGGGVSEVKFRIDGRELVGIMNKQNNIYTRSK